MANIGAAGSGALSGAGQGAMVGSIVPGIGTAVGAGIGAGVGFFKGLFSKKPDSQLIADYDKTAQAGGYVTVPKGGIPGHPEWKPGSRQWIPPGSPSYGSSTGIGGGGGAGIDYDAIRARSIAPTRAIYQNAMRNLKRQPGMGMKSPGYGAQLAALSRGMSSDISDAATGAEATVADTRLKEMGQQQQYQLGQRQLDIQEKAQPSSLSKGLSTTSQVLGLIGTGANIAGGMGGLKGLNFGGGGGTKGISDVKSGFQFGV